MVENDERGNIMAEQQEGKPIKEEEEEQDVEALRAELESVKSELRRAKESSETNLNKMKYLMADFDNYRKQMEKQLASKAESIKAELLLKFLNIRDDYLRALSVARQSKSEQGVVVIEGLEGILKNIDSLFASEGVREIEAIGTPFDPNVHDAIAYSARDDLAENTVTAEIRKGYMLNNRVLRPSLVEISKKIIKNSVNDTKEIDIQGGEGGG
ncbi:MAG TPA: nucleotide exchange factor GrpE [Nitrososphaera sp.]|nr:nucleotide exchange factor GrpE [Nitrososphaera sp.]